MRKFSRATITAVVIANMVGTGVFTSLGFQLNDIESGFVLLMLWLVGGIAAFCGAMSYAELGAALPRSGGEYNFLSRIFHPSAGFVSGWISASVGFTAPVALAALTFAAYASASVPALASPHIQKSLAIALIVVLTAIHTSSHRNSGGLQNFFTILKVVVIIGFCAGALIFVDELQPISVLPQAGDGKLLFSGSFAVALIYVSYAYAGWNSATYLSSEIDQPQKNLPRILFVGTLTVTLMYLALNFVFLKVAPISAMTNQIEVGAIAAEAAFGGIGGKLVGVTLALLLISTVSAMTVAGPRVLQVVGEDFPTLSVLGKTNKDGVPSIAIMTQSAIAVSFILLADFQSILLSTGFILAVNNFATVSSLFVLRYTHPDLPRPYRTFAYPLTPLLFLVLTAWTIVFVISHNPKEALFGLGLIVGGIVIYILSNRNRDASISEAG